MAASSEFIDGLSRDFLRAWAELEIDLYEAEHTNHDDDQRSGNRRDDRRVSDRSSDRR